MNNLALYRQTQRMAQKLALHNGIESKFQIFHDVDVQDAEVVTIGNWYFAMARLIQEEIFHHEIDDAVQSYIEFEKSSNN